MYNDNELEDDELQGFSPDASAAQDEQQDFSFDNTSDDFGSTDALEEEQPDDYSAGYSPVPSTPVQGQETPSFEQMMQDARQAVDANIASSQGSEVSDFYTRQIQGVIDRRQQRQQSFLEDADDVEGDYEDPLMAHSRMRRNLSRIASVSEGGVAPEGAEGELVRLEAHKRYNRYYKPLIMQAQEEARAATTEEERKKAQTRILNLQNAANEDARIIANGASGDTPYQWDVDRRNVNTVESLDEYAGNESVKLELAMDFMDSIGNMKEDVDNPALSMLRDTTSRLFDDKGNLNESGLEVARTLITRAEDRDVESLAALCGMSSKDIANINLEEEPEKAKHLVDTAAKAVLGLEIARASRDRMQSLDFAGQGDLDVSEHIQSSAYDMAERRFKMGAFRRQMSGTVRDVAEGLNASMKDYKWQVDVSRVLEDWTPHVFSDSLTDSNLAQERAKIMRTMEQTLWNGIRLNERGDIILDVKTQERLGEYMADFKEARDENGAGGIVYLSATGVDTMARANGLTREQVLQTFKMELSKGMTSDASFAKAGSLAREYYDVDMSGNIVRKFGLSREAIGNPQVLYDAGNIQAAEEYIRANGGTQEDIDAFKNKVKESRGYVQDSFFNKMQTKWSVVGFNDYYEKVKRDNPQMSEEEAREFSLLNFRSNQGWWSELAEVSGEALEGAAGMLAQMVGGAIHGAVRLPLFYGGWCSEGIAKVLDGIGLASASDFFKGVRDWNIRASDWQDKHDIVSRTGDTIMEWGTERVHSSAEFDAAHGKKFVFGKNLSWFVADIFLAKGAGAIAKFSARKAIGAYFNAARVVGQGGKATLAQRVALELGEMTVGRNMAKVAGSDAFKSQVRATAELVGQDAKMAQEEFARSLASLDSRSVTKMIADWEQRGAAAVNGTTKKLPIQTQFADVFMDDAVQNVIFKGIQETTLQQAMGRGVTSYFIGKAGASYYAGFVHAKREEAIQQYCAIHGIDRDEYESKVDEETRDTVRRNADRRSSFSLYAHTTTAMFTSLVCNFMLSQNIPWFGKTLGTGIERKIASSGVEIAATDAAAKRAYGGFIRTAKDMIGALTDAGLKGSTRTVVAAKILGTTLANTFRSGTAEAINDFSDAATTYFLNVLGRQGWEKLSIAEMFNSALEGGLLGFVGAAGSHNVGWYAPKIRYDVAAAHHGKNSGNFRLEEQWRKINDVIDSAGKRGQDYLTKRLQEVRNRMYDLRLEVSAGKNVEKNNETLARLKAVEAELSGLHWTQVTPNRIARLFDGDDTVAQSLLELREKAIRAGFRKAAIEIEMERDNVNAGLQSWLAQHANEPGALLYEAQFNALQLVDESQKEMLGVYKPVPQTLEDVTELLERMNELATDPKMSARRDILQAKKDNKENLTELEDSELTQIQYFQEAASKYAKFLEGKKADLESVRAQFNKKKEADKEERSKRADDAEREASKVQQKAEELKRKEQEHKEKLEKAAADKVGVMQEIADTNAQKQLVEEQIAEESKQVEAIEEALQSKPDDVALLERLEKSNAKIQKLQEQSAKFDEKIKKAERKIARIDKSSGASKTELVSIREQIRETQAKYTLATQIAKRLGAARDSMSNAEILESTAADILSAKAELESAQQQLEEVQTTEFKHKQTRTKAINAANRRIEAAQGKLQSLQDKVLNFSERGLLADIAEVGAKMKTLAKEKGDNISLEESNPFQEGTQAYHVYDAIVNQIKYSLETTKSKSGTIQLGKMLDNVMRQSGLEANESMKSAVSELVLTPILKSLAESGIVTFKTANTISVNRNSSAVPQPVEASSSSAPLTNGKPTKPNASKKKRKVASDTAPGNSAAPPKVSASKPISKEETTETAETTEETAPEETETTEAKQTPADVFLNFQRNSLISRNPKIDNTAEVPYNNAFRKVVELLVTDDGISIVNENEVAEFIDSMEDVPPEVKLQLKTEGIAEIAETLGLERVGSQLKFKLTAENKREFSNTLRELQAKFGKNVFDPIENAKTMQTFDRAVDEQTSKVGKNLMEELKTLGMATDGSYTTLNDSAFLDSLNSNYAGHDNMKALNMMVSWLRTAGVLGDIAIRPVINDAMSKQGGKAVTYRNGMNGGHHQFIIEINVGKMFDQPGHILEQLAHEVGHAFFSEVAFKNQAVSKALADVAIEARAQILMNQDAILAQFRSQFWMLSQEMRERAVMKFNNMLYGCGLKLEINTVGGETRFSIVTNRMTIQTENGPKTIEIPWSPQEFYTVAISNNMMNWALNITGAKADAAMREFLDLRTGRQFLGLIMGNYAYGLNREIDKKMVEDTLDIIDTLCAIESKEGAVSEDEVNALTVAARSINKGIKQTMTSEELAIVETAPGLGENVIDYGAVYGEMASRDGAMFNVIGPHAKTWAKYAGKTFFGRDDNMERAEIDSSNATFKPIDMRSIAGNRIRDGLFGDKAFVARVNDMFSIGEMRSAMAQRIALATKNVITERMAQGFLREHSNEIYDSLESSSGAAQNAIVNGLLGLVKDIPYQNFKLKASEVLDFAELYEAYPQLASFPVTFVPQSALGHAAGRVVSGQEIELSENFLKGIEEGWKNADSLKSTLLHELQHVIQHIEGYAIGGGLSKTNTANTFDNYLRLAGEIESRNVQARMNMTDEERAATPFNDTLEFTKDSAIVIMGNKPAIAASVSDLLYTKQLESKGEVVYDVEHTLNTLAENAKRNSMPEHGDYEGATLTASHPIFDNVSKRSMDVFNDEAQTFDFGDGQVANFRVMPREVAFNLIGTQANNFLSLVNNGRAAWIAKDAKTRVELDTNQCVWKTQFTDEKGKTFAYESPWERLPVLGKYIIWGNFMPIGKVFRLKDVIDYPELYEAYPFIGDINIKREFTLSSRELGYYDDGKKLIAFSHRSSLDEARNTILHEIQHIIQRYEGFSRGGAPSSVYSLFDILGGEIMGVDLAASELSQKLTPEEKADRISSLKEKWKDSEAWRNSLIEKIENREDADGRFGVYHRLLGEVEARTVEKRSKYTMEQRESIPFEQDYDVSLEELILSFDTKLDWLAYFSRVQELNELRMQNAKKDMEHINDLLQQGKHEDARREFMQFLRDSVENMQNNPYRRNADVDVRLHDGAMFNTIGVNARTFNPRAKGVFEARDGTLRMELDTSAAKLKDIYYSPKAYTREFVAERVEKAIGDKGQEFIAQMRSYKNIADKAKEEMNKATDDESQDFWRAKYLEATGKYMEMFDSDTMQRMALRLANNELVESGYNRNNMLLDKRNVLATTLKLALVDKDSESYDEAMGMMFGPFRVAGRGIKKLSEVLDFPQLFEAYPELADLDVRIGNALSMYNDKGTGAYSFKNDGVYWGCYDHDGGFIQLNPVLERYGYAGPAAALSTILHELQHWIQWREGWNVTENLADLEGVEYLIAPEEAESRTVELRRLMSKEEKAKESFNETFAKVVKRGKRGIDYTTRWKEANKNDTGKDQSGFGTLPANVSGGEAGRATAASMPMFNRINFDTQGPDFVRKMHDDLVATVNAANMYDKAMPIRKGMAADEVFEAMFLGTFLNNNGRRVEALDNKKVYEAAIDNGFFKKAFTEADVTDNFVFAIMSALNDARTWCKNVPEELLNTFHQLRNKEELEEFKQMIRDFINSPEVTATGADAGAAMLAGFARLVGMNAGEEVTMMDMKADVVPGVFRKLNEHMLEQRSRLKFKLRRSKFDKTLVQRQKESGLFVRDINDFVMDFLPKNFREKWGLNWRNIRTGSDMASEMRVLEQEMKIQRGDISHIYHAYNNALKKFVNGFGRTEEEKKARVELASKVLGSNRSLYNYTDSQEIEQVYEEEMRVNAAQARAATANITSTYNGILGDIATKRKAARKERDDARKRVEQKRKANASEGEIASAEAVLEAKQEALDAVESAYNTTKKAYDQELQVIETNRINQEKAITAKASESRTAARRKIVAEIRREQEAARKKLEAMAERDSSARELLRMTKNIRRTIDEMSKERAKYDPEFAEDVQMSTGFYLSRLYMTSLGEADAAQKRFQAIRNATPGDVLFQLNKRVAKRAAEDVASKCIDGFRSDWQESLAQARAVDAMIAELEAMEGLPEAEEQLARFRSIIDKEKKFMSSTFSLAQLAVKDKEAQDYYAGFVPYLLAGDEVLSPNGDTFQEAWGKSRLFKRLVTETLTQADYDYRDPIAEMNKQKGEQGGMLASDTLAESARDVMHRMQNQERISKPIELLNNAREQIKMEGAMKLLIELGFRGELEALASEAGIDMSKSDITKVTELVSLFAQQKVKETRGGNLFDSGNDVFDVWLRKACSVGQSTVYMPGVDEALDVVTATQRDAIVGIEAQTATDALVQQLKDCATDNGYSDGINRNQAKRKMVKDLLESNQDALWGYVNSLFFESSDGKPLRNIGGINDMKTRHDLPEEYMQMLGAQMLDNIESLMDTVQLTVTRGLRASAKIEFYDRIAETFQTKGMQDLGFAFMHKPTAADIAAKGLPHKPEDYVKLSDPQAGWVPNGVPKVSESLYVLRTAVEDARQVYDNFMNNTDADSTVEDKAKARVFGRETQRYISAVNAMPLISGITPMLRNMMGMIPMLVVPNGPLNIGRGISTAVSFGQTIYDFGMALIPGSNSRTAFFEKLDAYRQLGVIESDQLYSIRNTDWDSMAEFATKTGTKNPAKLAVRGIEWLKNKAGKMYSLPDCLGKIAAFEGNFQDLCEFKQFKQAFLDAERLAKADGISTMQIRANHMLLQKYMDAETFDTISKTALRRMSYEQPSSMTTPDWVKFDIPIYKSDNAFTRSWKYAFNAFTQINGPFLMFHYNMLRSVWKNVQFGLNDVAYGFKNGDFCGQFWSGLNRLASACALLLSPIARVASYGRFAKEMFSYIVIGMMNSGVDDERNKWRLADTDNSELLQEMIDAKVLADYWDTQDGIVLMRTNGDGTHQFLPVMTDFVNPFAGYESTARLTLRAFKDGDWRTAIKAGRSLLGPLADHHLAIQRAIEAGDLIERRDIAYPDRMYEFRFGREFLGLVGGILSDNPKLFLDGDQKLSPFTAYWATVLASFAPDIAKRAARFYKAYNGSADERTEDAKNAAWLSLLGFGSLYPQNSVKRLADRYIRMEQRYSEAYYWMEMKEKKGELSAGGMRDLQDARDRLEAERANFAEILGEFERHTPGVIAEVERAIKERSKKFKPLGVSKEGQQAFRSYIQAL